MIWKPLLMLCRSETLAPKRDSCTPSALNSVVPGAGGHCCEKPWTAMAQGFSSSVSAGDPVLLSLPSATS